jgi:type II secretory pathway predicted ATPase ExeA
MYQEYYKLIGQPFRLTPDYRSIFFGGPHKAAMAQLRYALAQGKGVAVITGEVGAGKTTLINSFISSLGQLKWIVGKLVTSRLEDQDLLRMVALAFGIREIELDQTTLLTGITSFLKDCHRAKRLPLLFVDEVQGLPCSSLEVLSRLSSIELSGRSLLQIFLVGQPQFKETLADASLEPLRQQVIASYHLGALDAKETRQYIAHRLRHFGWQDDPRFSLRAFQTIYEQSAGIPRRINLLCNRLLIHSYLDELHWIDHATVMKVASEMQSEGLATAPDSQFQRPDTDELERPIEQLEPVEIANHLENADLANRELAETDPREPALGYCGFRETASERLTNDPELDTSAENLSRNTDRHAASAPPLARYRTGRLSRQSRAAMMVVILLVFVGVLGQYWFSFTDGEIKTSKSEMIENSVYSGSTTTFSEPGQSANLIPPILGVGKVQEQAQAQDGIQSEFALEQPESSKLTAEEIRSAEAQPSFPTLRNGPIEEIDDQQTYTRLVDPANSGIVIPDPPPVFLDIEKVKKPIVSDSDFLPLPAKPSKIDQRADKDSEIEHQARRMDSVESLVASDAAATNAIVTVTGNFVIQLAAVRSADQTMKERSRLMKGFADLLGNLELKVQRADVNGLSYFRIRTHPLRNRSTALHICAQFKSKGQDCIVIPHAPNALSIDTQRTESEVSPP